MAALARTWARAFGLRSAAPLRNVPATERVFNAFRTALDLTVAVRFWPMFLMSLLAFLWPTFALAFRLIAAFDLSAAARLAARLGPPRPAKRWPRKSGRPAKRDVAGRPAK